MFILSPAHRQRKKNFSGEAVKYFSSSNLLRFVHTNYMLTDVINRE